MEQIVAKQGRDINTHVLITMLMEYYKPISPEY